MSDVRNVIIIGSGPAGYTAAVYSARADLKPLVFEGSVTAGGALMNTTDVENFPGFPDGIMGPDLMDNLRKQAERFGAELVTDDVVEVDLTADAQGRQGRHRHLPRQGRHPRHGSGYRELGLPNEKRLSGHGVSWCATCDGFFFRDQDIVVVGGGDTAMEEATFLTRFARIGHRRPPPRRAARQQDHAGPGVRQRQDPVRLGQRGRRRPRRRQASTGVRLRNLKTGEESELEATGLFVAIGHDPRTELVKGQVDLDDEGYIKVDAPTTRDQPRRRVRRGRRRRPHLPSGHHRRRHRLRGGARRRALAGRPRKSNHR